MRTVANAGFGLGAASAKAAPAGGTASVLASAVMTKLDRASTMPAGEVSVSVTRLGPHAAVSGTEMSAAWSRVAGPAPSTTLAGPGIGQPRSLVSVTPQVPAKSGFALASVHANVAEPGALIVVSSGHARMRA